MRLLWVLAFLLASPAMAQMIVSGAPKTTVSLGTGGAVPVTGTVTETNLVAVKVPAGTLGANGRAECDIFFTYPTSANTKNLIARAATTSGAISGGTIYLNQSSTTTTSFRASIFIQNQNATNSQVGGPNTIAFGTSSAALITSAIDTTADFWININAIVAGAGEVVTLTSYRCLAWTP